MTVKYLKTAVSDIKRAMAADTSASTCNLQIVSNRRELLIGFGEHVREAYKTGDNYPTMEEELDAYEAN